MLQCWPILHTGSGYQKSCPNACISNTFNSELSAQSQALDFSANFMRPVGLTKVSESLCKAGLDASVEMIFKCD